MATILLLLENCLCACADDVRVCVCVWQCMQSLINWMSYLWVKISPIDDKCLTVVLRRNW